MVQEIFHVKSQNKYIILNYQSSEKMGIKCISRCKDKEQKKVKGQGSGRFWMYTQKLMNNWSRTKEYKQS